MLLNKGKGRKVKIENPFRPPPRFARKTTRCRITVDSDLSCIDSKYYGIQIDADKVEAFEEQIKTLPEKERYFDTDFEMWFTRPKHLAKVKRWAKPLFDEVIMGVNQKRKGSYEEAETC